MKSGKKSVLAASIFMGFVTAVLLLPGLSHAGSLDPAGPPAPTMKTLDEIPPTWSQILQCDTVACPRFELVMGGAAVLDKETGLVWEQSPENATYTWTDALIKCHSLEVGGRQGWRLPTVEQLTSLVDPAQSSPVLPSGHPFGNVQSSVQSSLYWSATTYADSTVRAWLLRFFDGRAAWGDKTFNGVYVWCVRGGQGYDVY